MSARRIGILGGTFDPIHSGHVDAGHAAALAVGLNRLIVVPSHIPPHRTQPQASPYHRFAMAALAVGGNAGWRVSDLELRIEAASYTSATLAKFHERGYLPSELFFIVGADAFSDITSWHDYPDILDQAHFAVVSRPRFPVADLPSRLPQLKARMALPPNSWQSSMWESIVSGCQLPTWLPVHAQTIPSRLKPAFTWGLSLT